LREGERRAKRLECQGDKRKRGVRGGGKGKEKGQKGKRELLIGGRKL